MLIRPCRYHIYHQVINSKQVPVCRWGQFEQPDKYHVKQTEQQRMDHVNGIRILAHVMQQPRSVQQCRQPALLKGEDEDGDKKESVENKIDGF